MTAFLRQTGVVEIEGDRLRLHASLLRPGERLVAGRTWLILSPSDDPEAGQEEVQVELPAEQAQGLIAACAAFNQIMDAHERARAAALLALADHSIQPTRS